MPRVIEERYFIDTCGKCGRRMPAMMASTRGELYGEMDWDPGRMLPAPKPVLVRNLGGGWLHQEAQPGHYYHVGRCAECGSPGRLRTIRRVEGATGRLTKCGVKCRNARGSDCDCVCMAACHGAGLCDPGLHHDASKDEVFVEVAA